MKKYSGFLFGFFAAALVLAAAFLFGTVPVKAEGHEHCICGTLDEECAFVMMDASHAYRHRRSVQTYTALSDEATLRAAAATPGTHYFYLDGNITLTGSRIALSSGVKIYLCLNGQTITAAENKRAFSVGDEDADDSILLSICDCGSGGTIQADPDTTMESMESDLDGIGGLIYVGNRSTLELYGGKIANGKAYKGKNGGNIAVKSGVFAMFGGYVSAGTANAGGNVAMAANGFFYMYGGVIGGGLNNGGNGYEVLASGTVVLSGTAVVRTFVKNDDTDAIGYKHNKYSVSTTGTTNFTLEEDACIRRESSADSALQSSSSTGTITINGGYVWGKTSITYGTCTVNGGHLRQLAASATSEAKFKKLTVNGGFFTAIPEAGTKVVYSSEPITVAKYTKFPSANAAGVRSLTSSPYLYNYMVTPMAHRHAPSVHVSGLSEEAPSVLGENITWIPWGDTRIEQESLPTVGSNAADVYYYLTNDVTISASYSHAVKNTYAICLNGHTITVADTVLMAHFGSSDDSGEATVVFTDCHHIAFEQDGSLSPYGKIVVNRTGKTNTETTLRLFRLARKADLYLFNIGTDSSGAVNRANNGGVIYADRAANITIVNSRIIGAEVAQGAGAIYITGVDDSEKGHLTILASEILNGKAGTSGGNIIAQSYSEVTIKDSLLFGGTAAQYGGNLYVGGNASVLLSDVILKEGYAGKFGGNICQGGATSDLTMKDTDCRKGESGGSGGNVYLDNGTTVINGGFFSESVAGASGSNLYAAPNSDLTILDGVFLEGQATVTSSIKNLYLNGKFTISGGYFDRSGNGNALYIFKEATDDSVINGGFIERVFVYPYDGSDTEGHLAYGSVTNNVVTYTQVNAFIYGGNYVNKPNENYLTAGKKQLCTIVKDADRYYNGDTTKKAMRYKFTEGSAVELVSQTDSGEMGVAALSGAAIYEIGEVLTFTAPDDAMGYEFIGWFEGAYTQGAMPYSTEKSIEVTVGQNDAVYTAVYKFGADTYTLTVNGSMFTIMVGEKVVSYVEGGIEIKSGAEVVLTYAGDESEMDFHGWQNLSGKTLTSSGEYSFTMLKDTEIKANEAAKNVKTIVFTNGSGQVLYSLTGTLDALPALPVRVGYDSEWSKTLAEINESEAKYVTVAAVFTKKDVEKYTVTIEDVREGKDNVSRALNPVDLGSRVLLTAAEYEGYKFAYFKDADEKILSYTAPVYSIFGADTTVYAVYVAEAVEVVKKPTMNLAETVEETAGGKITKFTATRDIPEGYTLFEHGILYAVGTVSEAKMYYGAETVRKAISDATGMLGTVSLNIGLVPNGYSITARGYAILRDAEGNMSYLYSDILTVTAAQ